MTSAVDDQSELTMRGIDIIIIESECVYETHRQRLCSATISYMQLYPFSWIKDKSSVYDINLSFTIDFKQYLAVILVI